MQMSEYRKKSSYVLIFAEYEYNIYIMNVGDLSPYPVK